MAFKMAGSPYPKHKPGHKGLGERFLGAVNAVGSKVSETLQNVQGDVEKGVKGTLEIPGKVADSVRNARANNPAVQSAKAKRQAKRAENKKKRQAADAKRRASVTNASSARLAKEAAAKNK